MVDGLCTLLACRRAMKDYGCAGWFAYRGCPPEMPYQAMPPELWAFMIEADNVEAQVLKEQIPGGERPE